jgi:hypothetical protein
MRSRLVLAIAPSSRGFGYVIFADRGTPVDWGVKEIRADKNRSALLKIEEMLRRIVPASLVIEDWEHKTCRRSLRVKLLLKQAADLAEAQRVQGACYSRQHVRQFFRPMGKSKDAIAAAIVKEIPAFRPWLPRKRRIWDSERHSMAIFEAAALALVHYGSQRLPKTAYDNERLPL